MAGRKGKQKKSAGAGSRSSGAGAPGSTALPVPAGKGMILVDPARCRFQHSRIRPYFSGCGRSVYETLESIKSGATRLSDLPPIQVMVGGSGSSSRSNSNSNNDNDNDGNNDNDDNGPWYFSLNNRRLWVLKQLRREGFLEAHGNKVAVRVRTPKSKQERDRYTVANCSLEARLMGGKKKAAPPQTGGGNSGGESPAPSSATPPPKEGSDRTGGGDNARPERAEGSQAAAGWSGPDSDGDEDSDEDSDSSEEPVVSTRNRFSTMLMVGDDSSSSSSSSSDGDE